MKVKISIIGIVLALYGIMMSPVYANWNNYYDYGGRGGDGGDATARAQSNATSNANVNFSGSMKSTVQNVVDNHFAQTYAPTNTSANNNSVSATTGDASAIQSQSATTGSQVIMISNPRQPLTAPPLPNNGTPFPYMPYERGEPAVAAAQTLYALLAQLIPVQGVSHHESVTEDGLKGETTITWTPSAAYDRGDKAVPSSVHVVSLTEDTVRYGGGKVIYLGTLMVEANAKNADSVNDFIIQRDAHVFAQAKLGGFKNIFLVNTLGAISSVSGQVANASGIGIGPSLSTAWQPIAAFFGLTASTNTGVVFPKVKKGNTFVVVACEDLIPDGVEVLSLPALREGVKVSLNKITVDLAAQPVVPVPSR